MVRSSERRITMQETRNDLSSMENETGHRVGGGYTPVNQLVSPVGPQFMVPFTSVDSRFGDQEPIHMFGQSQFHDNLGPVYALPTYPWPHGQHPHAANPPSHQGSYPHTGNGQWQHSGIHPSPMMVPVYYYGWQPMKCNHCQ